MVTIDEDPRNELSTWHATGPFAITKRWVVRQQGTRDFDLHKESVQKIQELMGQCAGAGQRFRALGSLWSLNDIAFNNGWVLNNREMDMRLELSAANLHANSGIAHENLVFTQCGATINQLSTYLLGKGKSLKVSGGSNGQTVAGATATGVHGAAFDEQCITDYIKGLHIIIGPMPEDRIYLERDSDPVLNDAFAHMLDSRPVRDDGVFNAAIVGLGSFGFIAAIVMEVEDIYSLRRYVRKINYDDAVNLSQSLDFENSPFRIPEETHPNGTPIRPYHFKTFFNQYTKDCVAEVMYKITYTPTQYPEVDISTQLHPDLFRLMRWALDKSDGKVTKLLTSLLQGEAMPKPDNPAPLTGTLGDIFRAVNFQQASFSWALAVDQGNLRRAMEIWLNIFRQNRAPGLSAIRVVRQTKATLGFQRFPVTAVLHMDGVQWTPAADQLHIQREILRAYNNEGIPFTLHWGKNADWNFPTLIDIMYPTQKDEWKKHRCRLLSQEMAFMFSNDFINRLGLDEYVGPGPVV